VRIRNTEANIDNVYMCAVALHQSVNRY
jgi:hypothetical protein